MLQCHRNDCTNKVSPNRHKYCSLECQEKTAKEYARRWRELRAEEEKLEKELDIPPRTRRYAVRGYNQIWADMYDENLISFRNPTGSLYVEKLIRLVDKGFCEEEDNAARNDSDLKE